MIIFANVVVVGGSSLFGLFGKLATFLKPDMPAHRRLILTLELLCTICHHIVVI